MLMHEKQFRRTPILLSGAGSAWYDIVAEEFRQASLEDSVEIVLRPGCYITHDSGIYAAAQRQVLDRNSSAAKMQSGLESALQIWAYVQSIPEKERAIIGMGKRDASFDSGLPVPELYFRPGADAPRSAPGHWAVTRMMDQHAFLQMASGDDLRVRDMIGFGISHPCLTFDKWRTLPVIDSQYEVVDVIRTFF
jgi:D-serine dehydratase